MRVGSGNGLCTGLMGVVCLLLLVSSPHRTATAAGAACARPAGNTGSGFYVGCGRVNNTDGTEYRIRGVVRAHFDVPAAQFVVNTKANTVRTYYAYESGTLGKFRADVQALLARGLTPVASMDSYSGILSSCRTEPGLLASQLTRWVRDAGTWTTLNAKGLIDLSSEWGPASTSAWRDQTVAAVRTLRAAGYTMPVMIDSGTCSRNQMDFNARAAEVAAADPQHNVVFWMRLDGNTPSSATLHTQVAALAALSAANPRLAFVTGVFGPGSNLPATPVVLTPDDMIKTSESNSLGWMTWNWDSSNQTGCVADNSSGSLLANPCNGYTGQGSQLTTYGQQVLAELSSYATGQPYALPPEAAQAGYFANTFSVANFTTATVDTTNSKAAGFKFYPYNLFSTTPPLTDLQLNADGSITLLGANTGPNGELVTATPLNSNRQYHGTGFGGGALFEATLLFATGVYSKASSGGWPSWWSEPLETGVTYNATGSDQWIGQVAGYHHGVENDFIEYQNGGMGSALHESWGKYAVTCPPSYCVLNSALPRWTMLPNLTQSHRYGMRWTPATATSVGKSETYLDGMLQSTQAWQQFTTQQPSPNGQPWAFGAMDGFHYVLIVGTGPGAPVTVQLINVWQQDATKNVTN